MAHQLRFDPPPRVGKGGAANLSLIDGGGLADLAGQVRVACDCGWTSVWVWEAEGEDMMAAARATHGED